MDKWLIKPKLTYEQLAAKLAIAESELATLKEANAKRGTSSVDKALKELNALTEKSRWAAEIATACSLAPGDCTLPIIEFGAALDSSTNDTVLPEVTQLLPGFACSLTAALTISIVPQHHVVVLCCLVGFRRWALKGRQNSRLKYATYGWLDGVGIKSDGQPLDSHGVATPAGLFLLFRNTKVWSCCCCAVRANVVRCCWVSPVGFKGETKDASAVWSFAALCCGHSTVYFNSTSPWISGGGPTPRNMPSW